MGVKKWQVFTPFCANTVFMCVYEVGTNHPIFSFFDSLCQWGATETLLPVA